MTWLLQALRAREVILVSLVAGALAALLRGQHAPVPSITGGGLAPVPLVAVLALLPVVASLRLLEGLPAHQAATAVRSVRSFWTLGVVLVVTVTAAAAGALAGREAAYEVARNAAGLSGIAILAWRLVGRGSAVGAALAYLVLAFLFGATGSVAEAQVWAWVLRSSDDLASWLCATLLLASGLAALRTAPQAQSSVAR